MTSRILFLVSIALPRIASACAVCFSGRDETRLAYVLTTVLLTALPLALLGGFLWWLRRRARALECETQEHQASTSLVPRG